MSSPTIIRHAARGNTILQVVSSFDSLRGRVDVAFQWYTVLEDGRTYLNVSEVYSSEEAAVEAWNSARIALLYSFFVAGE